MNTIFFHRADPVTKGEGGAKNKSALRPYPERRPREFHEWVYPKRAETMAEFGTKATENAHAIRACKPVHVLSLRTSFQTWISFPFSRILLLVRVTIGGERERERRKFSDYSSLRWSIKDDGARGKRWKSICDPVDGTTKR